MTKFTDAFRNGLTAAKGIRENHKDVQRVLMQLKDEVFIETNGRVRIKICKLVSRTALNWKALDQISALKETPLHYHAVCGDNPLVRDSLVELANWEQDEKGFPCIISYQGFRKVCQNREELEQGLHDMLSSQEVGIKIAGLLALEIPGESPPADRNQVRLNRAIRRTNRISPQNLERSRERAQS